MESVGFKEWALVCEALGRGDQSVILRKGGIAEGRDGFSFRHRDFFLFPTWFHEQREKVRAVDLDVVKPNPDCIGIRFFARIESSHLINSLRVAEALEPLHVLRPEVVRERFEYDDEPGLHVAFVRVCQLQDPWTISNEKKYGGCKSWVDLPGPPPELRLNPVLTDAEHDSRRDLLKSLLA